MQPSNFSAPLRNPRIRPPAGHRSSPKCTPETPTCPRVHNQRPKTIERYLREHSRPLENQEANQAAPPAQWLRSRLVNQLLVIVGVALVTLGVIIGHFLGRWFATEYVVIAAAGVTAISFIWMRADRRWSLSNLEKGLNAEYRVGQVIDHSLMPPNCAVAHGVTDPRKEGDIDHLVATPCGLWVVETKARAVPRKRVRGVLDRIAANVHAIEAWAPGIPVRGCLVLLEPFPGKRNYQATDGTPVVVHDEKTLRDALRAEAGDDGPVGRELARRVWALGQTVE